MIVVNTSGVEINFESAIELMDEDIREKLHSELVPCTEQEFFSAYEKAHEEKFGEPWLLSEEDPIW